MPPQPLGPPKLVTQAGEIPGLDVTPVFANRFNITSNPLFTRLAFGEFIAGDPSKDTIYHTAVVIPTPELPSFLAVIQSILAQRPIVGQAGTQVGAPGVVGTAAGVGATGISGTAAPQGSGGTNV